MDICTRYGYSLTPGLPRVLKRRDFARWQVREGLSDAALCKAVREMESGLIDADLGGALYKKRLARPGGGKRGGYRTVVSARIGQRYVFLHGFAKGEAENITGSETRALRLVGKVLLDLSHESLQQAAAAQELVEVGCESYH